MDDLIVWLRQQFDDDDPGSVALDVQAKRRLLELHARHGQPSPAGHDPLGYIYVNCESACLTLRLLAVSYSHRPGFREEWKP